MAEVTRKMGICEQTFRRRKKQYGGLGSSEVQKFSQLEEEDGRLKTIVDNYSRMSLGMLVEKKITGEMVSTFFSRIGYHSGLPKSIRVDNGPEFISKTLDKWASERKGELDFS